MYRLTDYAAMLRDRARIEAYRRALTTLLTPQSTVLDLGTGVGTFAILAAKLGAKHVYAVDSAEVITIAEQVARANGVADRVTFVRTRATALQLPERVDIVLSDLGGALPIFEEHIPALIHAREHLLKPGGTLIPRRARMMCAPISSDDLYAQIVEPWGVDGVDFAPARMMALQSAHALRVEPHHVVGEAQCWATLDYATVNSPDVRGTVRWMLPEERVVHGVALWFESDLHDGLTYASGPWSPSSVHATMVLPLATPRAASSFAITIESKLVDGRYVTTWSTEERGRTAMNIHADSIIAAAPGQLSAKLGDEAVIAAISRGHYFGLNPVAARVWQLLPGSVRELQRAIVAEYDVTPEQCESDLAVLLEQLREEGLIEVRG